ncbi:mirror-image polydactyly gene 1 protein [Genypterus blacodes]|uniref:mirror-image polydactyly gene 1 protein n=1 Tax=Genypterus blacodes TaxID=154954 RepID=UPI003F75A788
MAARLDLYSEEEEAGRRRRKWSGKLLLESNYSTERRNRHSKGTGTSSWTRDLSGEELRPPQWTPSRELKETLVDMYTANPRVNVELRQRLPSATAQQRSNATQQRSNTTQQRTNTTQQRSESERTSLSAENLDWTQGPQLLQDALISPSPLSTRRSLSPLTPLSQRRSLSPLSQRRSLSPSSCRSPGGAEGMEVELCPCEGPSPWAESAGEAPDRDEASSAPGSPAVRRHLRPEDSVNRGSAPVSTLDKNVHFLLKELDAVREINKKLQLQLVQKEKNLEDLQNKEEQEEVKCWERPAAVLEEVLSAQRVRDQAMMSRLLLANKERDEALLRSRRLQQAATSELNSMNLKDNDLDVDELLQCVCASDSGQEVGQFGAVLVQRLQLAQQRRNDIIAEEMKAVMEERDSSLAKCKQLEQDLIHEREQRAKEELLRRERDSALEDRQRLEAELQEQQANQSSQVPPPEAAGGKQAPPLLLQLQQLSRERQSMEVELQCCRQAEREACERVHRLERLVEVLRKKVGSGNLRPVI